MTQSVPRHPEAQTMAAFVDGTLDPKELATVAGHLRECAECRTVVAATARFGSEEAARDTRPPRTWWLAAAAIFAVIAIAIPIILSRNGSPIERLIAAAPRDHRTVDARLSGFAWARLQAPSRGNATPDPADLKFAGAAGDVLEATQNQSTPVARHAAGVAKLMIGQSADAMVTLERAANASNDARIWNDLAAARIAFAANEGHPSQLPLALADADRALRLDPNLAEAHFNRALILERLGLRDQARKQWQRSLEVDPASEWSLEARAHLHALDGNAAKFDPRLPADEMVRRFPQEARTYAETLFLAEWADAEAANDAAAASAALARVRAIARALAAFNGEQLLGDAVSAIEASSGERRRALVDAHRMYRSAKEEYSTRNVAAAEMQFRRAEELFRQGRSPMANVAAYFAASASSNQQLGGGAREQLSQLHATIDRKRHRALDAQICWQLAVIANIGGDWGTGAREADASAAIFRRLGEQSNGAFLYNVAAAAFEMMGERDLAWSHRIPTCAIFSASGERARLNAAVHGAAITLASRDEIPAATALLELMIDDARGDAAQLAAALSDRGRNALRIGDLAAARASIAEARTAATRVRDGALREIVGLQIELADATLLRATSEPRAAIATLDRTIPLLDREHLRGFLPDAHLQRGLAFRAAGDSGAALADDSAALREVESQRATIADPERRLAFLDTAAQIIEELIDLHLDRGAPAEAFAVADHARGGHGALPAPGNTTILEYAVLSRSVVLFCVSREGITAERVAIDRRELASRIDSFAEKIRRRSAIAEIQADGGALYRLLITPVRQRLSGVTELALVPDGQLFGLPFAVLWNETDHRYLAEELTIRIASAAASGVPQNETISPALVVADPPSLRWPRLPASREEGMHIASLHGAMLLAGEAATRSAFLEMAKKSALIHYAGHANSDAGESYGALLLADGVVGSGEIAALTLPLHPLVVLAACGTFRGDAAHVAGMSSLARSFLIAGARGVVGTLWEVDDDVSATLFSRFHEHLHTGARPAEALRAAQLEMLHAADGRQQHPASWAPVVLVNSGS
jgi:CHAT domain-containing protein/Tfp pilus assembly protein PilF